MMQRKISWLIALTVAGFVLAGPVAHAGGNPIKGASVSPFRGYHARVVNMMFGDGSVRSISVDIDPRIWVALSTIQGKEMIPGSD